jgi:hypothetical protein
MSRRRQSNARVLAEDCNRPLVWAVQVQAPGFEEWATAAGRFPTEAEAVLAMRRLAARVDNSEFRVVRTSQ